MCLPLTGAYQTANGEPLYHTVYETFALVDELYDPSFLVTTATATVAAQLTLSVANSLVRTLNSINTIRIVKN